MDRRRFLRAVALTPALAGLAGCATTTVPRSAQHVVVVGGGFGGATAAKYLRMWSEGQVAVTLIERDPKFTFCPASNLVIAGLGDMAELTADYDALRDRWGVRVVQGEVTDIDTERGQLRLADGTALRFDRAILSPGISFMPELVDGLAGNEARIPHAWKAGEQTLLLRRQLQAMPDGGIFGLHIPRSPYRCPPGPYERACLVAHYLRTHKPRSKVLVLDANSEIQSKKALFSAAFAGPYRDIIEYRPDSALLAVDARTLTATLEFDSVHADVLNVLPPMRAGMLADRLDAPLINGRWVEVDWLTLEASHLPGIHVIGDALFAAPGMPKSGHMANQHAKIAAAAILSQLAGNAPDAEPLMTNTCYSFIDDRQAMHVASVHRYDRGQNTFLPVQGAGGLSAAPSTTEAEFAHAWARNIRQDMLA
ncbi:sulfide dehydrogenase, flavoprtein subunit [Azoarcus sp. KH32C]|nr:sulfide dehydrogenase, flavoprtein subunit [Azoarcus sp. KH32C]